MTIEMKLQTQAVIAARDDLAAYVVKYGRNSGGAADRRRRLKQAEKKLLDMAIAQIGAKA